MPSLSISPQLHKKIRELTYTYAPWMLALSFGLAAHFGWFCPGHAAARVEIVTGDGSSSVLVGPGDDLRCESKAKRKAKQKAKQKAKRKRKAKPGKLGRQIHKAEETHTVPRALVDKLFAKPALLAHHGRAVPETNLRGDPIGFRLADVKPRGLIWRLGFRSGDVIRAVNGKPVDTIDDVLAAVAEFRDATDVAITTKRRRRVFEKRFVIE